MIDISAFHLLLTLLTGWLDRQERDVLRYLLEENRLLRRQLKRRRLQLIDDDGDDSPCVRIGYAVSGCGRSRPSSHLIRFFAGIGNSSLGSGRMPDVARAVVEMFMRHVGRTLTMADDGLLRAHRVLICDRDSKWSGEIRRVLNEGGIRVVQTPWRAPNANAHAERFIRSIKQECLDRVIPLGERHFRQTVSEYVVRYHHERNHQGLDNRLIEGLVPNRRQGRIRRRPRLGGLLNYYERVA